MWRRKAPLYGEWKQNGEVTRLLNAILVFRLEYSKLLTPSQVMSVRFPTS